MCHLQVLVSVNDNIVFCGTTQHIWKKKSSEKEGKQRDTSVARWVCYWAGVVLETAGREKKNLISLC